MRGVFFSKGLEYRLEVQGDEWTQGDSLSCGLSIKNRNLSRVSVSGLLLCLSLGDLKKVKAKAIDAFEPVSKAEFLSPLDLEPDEQKSFPWSFELGKNCPITDKSESLFLICGLEAEPAGQLQVNVLPHPHIEAVLSLFESFFSFVLKGQKSKKGWVEAKLKPPSGKTYPTLDHLLLLLQFDGEDMLLKFRFSVKKLETDMTSLDIKKGTKELEQRLSPNEYLLPGGFVNNDALEAGIEKALSVVATRF